METYIDLFLNGFTGYFNYLWSEITFNYDYKPWYQNYFYALILLSILVWIMEVVMPWRSGQKIIRKDFWLDLFYMFFNFFLFSLIIYNAVANVAVHAFNDFLGLWGVNNLVAIEIGTWPVWAQLVFMFVLADFIQWNIHRLLHRVPFLWQFHKLHHSVQEMGFAAHLRFHWMETVVYKSLQYIPLSMIGFGLDDFFIIHIIALFIGHINHANLNWDYGPLKYFLNNPKMHIWHHAKSLPTKYGVNYGLSLSIWDYIFGTAYVPSDGRDITIGFDGDDQFPADFLGQVTYPINIHRNS